MASKAITNNNAGIVEAIKVKSGSTKFYRPSFEGIIQAIQDWEGGSGGGGGTGDGIGSGSSVLPEGDNLPNTDNAEGDLVVIPNGDGDYFMYVYANGAWERLHVTTEDVEIAGSAPFQITLPDGTVLSNQADINAHLDERITTLSEEGPDSTDLPYSLVLGEVSSDNVDPASKSKSASDGVTYAQILETITLANTKGESLGSIAFESGGGVGISVSPRWKNTIYVQTYELQKRLDALENVEDGAEQVTYQIQTDKILRSGEAAIELVDSAGFFSDVKFTGQNGVQVTSDINGIIIDGSTINSTTRYNKGRIYAEELREAVMKRSYNIVNQTGIPTARPGEISVDTKKPGEVKAISFGENSSEGLAVGTVTVGDKLCMTEIDSGRKYFYNIISGTTNSGIYGVDFIEADSWFANSNLKQTPHYLEIFPRAAFGREVELANYYSKSEVDAQIKELLARIKSLENP